MWKYTIKGIIIFVLIAASAYLAYGACPTTRAIQCDGSPCVSNCDCPTLFSRFSCLSVGSSNNNGTYSSWLQCDANGCSINGDWSSPGVNGCCGMWDAGSGDSRTMMFILEQNRNEGSSNHVGEYDVEVDERNISQTGFFFTHSGWPMKQIPQFRIGTPIISTGTGGITSFTIVGWGSITGPAHYWARLAGGVSGTDLTLGNLCHPGGTSPCPGPILGYQVRALTAGCADGTCNDPTPAPPATGIVQNWNLSIGAAGTINGRMPTFPIAGITITNPTTCTPANRYIYIATQLRYADGFTSTYVSANSGQGTQADPIDWCYNIPAEASTSAPMQCSKQGTASLACTYSNGGSCTSNNTIYYGSLANVSAYSYIGSSCNLGITGTATFSPPDGDLFWVIVSNNGSKEGSYGKNSSGTERPEAVSIGTCDYPQELAHSCTYLLSRKK